MVGVGDGDRVGIGIGDGKEGKGNERTNASRNGREAIGYLIGWMDVLRSEWGKYLGSLMSSCACTADETRNQTLYTWFQGTGAWGRL